MRSYFIVTVKSVPLEIKVLVAFLFLVNVHVSSKEMLLDKLFGPKVLQTHPYQLNPIL